MRPLRALRARMAFFVDAIQFYLHADVLEPSWRQLDGRVRVRAARGAVAMSARARARRRPDSSASASVRLG